MEHCPLQHVPQRSGWKASVDEHGFYLDRDLMFPIYRVEVRDTMNISPGTAARYLRVKVTH